MKETPAQAPTPTEEPHDDGLDTYREFVCTLCGETVAGSHDANECVARQRLRAGQGGEATAPRTYQSAWQWNEDETPKLMTAEDWLIEEADVDVAINTRDDALTEEQNAVPNRGGILLAIAQEIQQLRTERTQWAETATRQAAELSTVRAAVREAIKERDALQAEIVRRNVLYPESGRR